MKAFISWSGETSKLVAEALRDWLPMVINAIEPWLSSEDIEPGARWSSDIASQLEQTRFGFICLTPQNLEAPWIHFEAGALSRMIDKSRVVPYLLNLKPTDLKGPLAQFQAVQADLESTKRVVYAINRFVAEEKEKNLEERRLDEVFEVWWPKLEKKLASIPRSQSPAPIRTERDLLEEILTLVRNVPRRSPLLNYQQEGVLLHEEISRLGSVILPFELDPDRKRAALPALSREWQRLWSQAVATRDAIAASRLTSMKESLGEIRSVTSSAEPSSPADSG